MSARQSLTRSFFDNEVTFLLTAKVLDRWVRVRMEKFWMGRAVV